MTGSDVSISLSFLLVVFGATVSLMNGVHTIERAQVDRALRLRWLGPAVSIVGLAAGAIGHLFGSAALGMPNIWLSVVALVLYSGAELARRRTLPARQVGRRGAPEPSTGGARWRIVLTLGHLTALLAVLITL